MHRNVSSLVFFISRGLSRARLCISTVHISRYFINAVTIPSYLWSIYRECDEITSLLIHRIANYFKITDENNCSSRHKSKLRVRVPPISSHRRLAVPRHFVQFAATRPGSYNVPTGTFFMRKLFAQSSRKVEKKKKEGERNHDTETQIKLLIVASIHTGRLLRIVK